MGEDAQFSASNELCFSKWNALWGKNLLWLVLYFQLDCMWHSHHPPHDLAMGSSRSFITRTNARSDIRHAPPTISGERLIECMGQVLSLKSSCFILPTSQQATFSIDAKMSADSTMKCLPSRKKEGGKGRGAWQRKQLLRDTLTKTKQSQKKSRKIKPPQVVNNKKISGATTLMPFPDKWTLKRIWRLLSVDDMFMPFHGLPRTCVPPKHSSAQRLAEPRHSNVLT